MTNKRIRIGKDIAISWEINSPMDLVDTDLTIQMKDPKGNKVDIEDFELVDKTISFGLRGTAFAYLGNYTLTLWYKKGEVGQTVVDVVGAFELVGSTEQEDEGCNCGCGALDVSTVDLYGDLTFPIIEGPKGDKGDPGEQGEPEKDGEDGQPGFSPIATVSKSGDTATITITDKNGTTTATVKDGSDASITIDSTPTQNSNNAVSSGGVYNAIASIPTPTPEIFWATYNTTTASEIQTALDAGKTVMCKYSNRIYTLDEIIANDRCNFHAFSGAGNNCRRIYILINTNTWGNSSVYLENTGARITSSSSTNPSDSNYYSALATKNLVDAVDAKIEGPWTKLVDTILEEDTTNTGLSVNLNKNCSKLKIIAVFPANESLSSNTSCYIGMTGHSGSTTLICGSSPLRSTPAKVIAEYTYESGLGWQGVITQFATATFNEDENNAYSVIYTNLRGANVGAVYSVRIYGNNVPLIAGTKIQIWGK